ncbi:MAG TPA: hypothetical protein VF587_07240 [Solirubrobacteraceae bacterium]
MRAILRDEPNVRRLVRNQSDNFVAVAEPQEAVAEAVVRVARERGGPADRVDDAQVTGADADRVDLVRAEVRDEPTFPNWGAEVGADVVESPGDAARVLVVVGRQAIELAKRRLLGRSVS